MNVLVVGVECGVGVCGFGGEQGGRGAEGVWDGERRAGGCQGCQGYEERRVAMMMETIVEEGGSGGEEGMAELDSGGGRDEGRRDEEAGREGAGGVLAS